MNEEQKFQPKSANVYQTSKNYTSYFSNGLELFANNQDQLCKLVFSVSKPKFSEVILFDDKGMSESIYKEHEFLDEKNIEVHHLERLCEINLPLSFLPKLKKAIDDMVIEQELSKGER